MKTPLGFASLLLVVGCAARSPRSPAETEQDKAFVAAVASANQHTGDIALQLEAIKLRLEMGYVGGQERAWLEPIAPALARVDRDGATCDELDAVDRAYARMATNANVAPEVKRAAQLWTKCPRLDSSFDFQLVFKRLGACEDFVSIAASLWPQAKSGLEQQRLIQSVENCSTPADRVAHLSFLPSDASSAHERDRSDQAQRDNADNLRELQHDVASSCWDSCVSSYNSCIQACSGDCTVCNDSKQRCLQSCPALDR